MVSTYVRIHGHAVNQHLLPIDLDFPEIEHSARAQVLERDRAHTTDLAISVGTRSAVLHAGYTWAIR
jgi:hypothetical protein